jgi:predicted Zn finger-like uncharacterized protein
MALATRCPQCHVLFRVVADQLKLRGGLVRCGACRHVFDAIGSLTYIDDSAAAAPEPAPARKAAPPTLHITAVVPPAQRTAADTVESPREPVREAREPAHVAREPAADAAKPEFTGPPTLLAPPDTRGGTPREAEKPAPAAAREEARQGATAERAAKGAAAAERQPPRRRRRESAETSAEESAPPAARALDLDFDEPAQEPEFLRAARSTARRGFSVFYGGGSVMLALLLLAQLAVVFRTELTTRWPQWRPALVQVCAVFGCHVGWPTRADLLAVIGTELQAIPGTDVLELTAVVRNRAGFKVALPAIEVTLTDTANRTIARKVFAPVDYLASAGEPSSRIDDGLGAGSDYTIRVAFEARGITAVGFVVYPFYL